MIFYFAGTGNSLYAAKKISSYLGEELVSISDAMHSGKTPEYEIQSNETIGFVFPLYCFSAPQMVFDFIQEVKLNGYAGQYIFAVATYGQNMGRFDRFFNEELAKRDVSLSAAFSLNMPNNYFNIWDKARQQECLDRAEVTINRICKAVHAHEPVVEITETKKVPEERTGIMHDIYNASVPSTKGFSVSDSCVGCGVCSKVCNGQCIKIVDGKPAWDGICTKCFACIHLCPQKAIQFEESTMGFPLSTRGCGRYKNPNIKVSELMHEQK